MSASATDRSSKRIAIIGNSGRIQNPLQKAPDRLFAECGNNTGNLAFWFAVSRHIKNAHVDYIPWHFDPELIKREYDVVVFVAANQLNPDWDLGSLADIRRMSDKNARGTFAEASWLF